MSQTRVKNEDTKRYLEMSVRDLDLSVRARRALQRCGVQNLEELAQLTESDLLTKRNFGMTSLREIKSELSQYGLELKKESRNPKVYKRQKIIEFAENGLTRRQIMQESGSSYMYVCIVIRSSNLTVPRQQYQRKINPSVADPLIAEGRTLREIGEELGVTHNAVGYYINRTGQYDYWVAAKQQQKINA